jgi:hypothetical protein
MHCKPKEVRKKKLGSEKHKAKAWYYDSKKTSKEKQAKRRPSD